MENNIFPLKKTAVSKKYCVTKTKYKSKIKTFLFKNTYIYLQYLQKVMKILKMQKMWSYL